MTRVRLRACPVCQASGTFTTEAPAKEDSRGAGLQDGDSCAEGGRRKFPWGEGCACAGPARPCGPRDPRWPRGGGFSPGEAGPRAEGGTAQGRAGPVAFSAGTPLGLGSQRVGPQASGHSAETRRAQSRRHAGCARFSDSPGPGLRGGGGATHVAWLCPPGPERPAGEGRQRFRRPGSPENSREKRLRRSVFSVGEV